MGVWASVALMVANGVLAGLNYFLWRQLGMKINIIATWCATAAAIVSAVAVVVKVVT